MSSRALTRIQSIILIILVLGVVVGSFVYFFWILPVQSSGTIKIGICGDLDDTLGGAVWQGAVLAAEQVNSEGGVLGRQFEIVAEDDDSEAMRMDTAVAINAMTRLITFDGADFVIASGGSSRTALVYQDICCDHKKILFTTTALGNMLTLRVLEDYERFKYFFRVGFGNMTVAHLGICDSILTLRNYTGFNKVAYLHGEAAGLGAQQFRSEFVDFLGENGFELVYDRMVPDDTVDFTSYLAAAEDAGAEILTAWIAGSPATLLVREWYDRQSPFVLWGILGDIGTPDIWGIMEGKCEFVSTTGYPVTSGYPLTTKTMSTREAYIERWGELPISFAAIAYDIVRFILPDAIKRAGTTETEALVSALEKTDVETSSARRFVFTSSHDVMIGEAGPNRFSEEYVLVCYFQWQNGMLVPVYPSDLMENSEATYKFPPWPGPWD